MRIILLILFLLPVLSVMGYFYLDIVDEYRKAIRGSRKGVKRQYSRDREFRVAK